MMGGSSLGSAADAPRAPPQVMTTQTTALRRYDPIAQTMTGRAGTRGGASIRPNATEKIRKATPQSTAAYMCPSMTRFASESPELISIDM